jgi:hypothetical protein
MTYSLSPVFFFVASHFHGFLHPSSLRVPSEMVFFWPPLARLSFAPTSDSPPSLSLLSIVVEASRVSYLSPEEEEAKAGIVRFSSQPIFPIPSHPIPDTNVMKT